MRKHIIVLYKYYYFWILSSLRWLSPFWSDGKLSLDEDKCLYLCQVMGSFHICFLGSFFGSVEFCRCWNCIGKWILFYTQSVKG